VCGALVLVAHAPAQQSPSNSLVAGLVSDVVQSSGSASRSNRIGWQFRMGELDQLVPPVARDPEQMLIGVLGASSQRTLPIVELVVNR
jgi:hypothetical protein